MKLDVNGQEDPRFVTTAFPTWNCSRRVAEARGSETGGGCVLSRVTHRLTEAEAGKNQLPPEGKV